MSGLALALPLAWRDEKPQKQADGERGTLGDEMVMSLR